MKKVLLWPSYVPLSLGGMVIAALISSTFFTHCWTYVSEKCLQQAGLSNVFSHVVSCGMSCQMKCCHAVSCGMSCQMKCCHAVSCGMPCQMKCCHAVSCMSCQMKCCHAVLCGMSCQMKCHAVSCGMSCQMKCHGVSCTSCQIRCCHAVCAETQLHADQDSGGLLLLRVRGSQAGLEPRGQLRQHGPHHDRGHQVSFSLKFTTLPLGSIHIWRQRSSLNRTWFIGH
jgi:hypothetical protein